MTSKPVRAPDSSSTTPDEHHNQSWQDLAQQACRETDPDKLMTIVKDLCTAIDEDGKPGSQKATGSSGMRKAQRP